MADEIEKITSVIMELDKQTQDLKHFSDVLKRIESLSAEVDALVVKIRINSNEYESFISQVGEQKEAIQKVMKEMFSNAKEANIKIETRLSSLESGIYKIEKNINIDKKIESLMGVMEEKNKTLLAKIESNQKTILNEISKVKEEVAKKKGLIF